MTNNLLNAQEGGRMEAVDKTSGGGEPVIDHLQKL